jgi:hypothetical protein
MRGLLPRAHCNGRVWQLGYDSMTHPFMSVGGCPELSLQLLQHIEVLHPESPVSLCPVSFSAIDTVLAARGEHALHIPTSESLRAP